MYENGDIDVFSKEKKEQNTTPKAQIAYLKCYLCLFVK